jgi:hypothetical protein
MPEIHSWGKKGHGIGIRDRREEEVRLLLDSTRWRFPTRPRGPGNEDAHTDGSSESE